jgi:hypothetical protein
MMAAMRKTLDVEQIYMSNHYILSRTNHCMHLF